MLSGSGDKVELERSEGDAMALPRGSMEVCESSQGTWGEATQAAPASATAGRIAEESAQACDCIEPAATTALRPPAAGPGESGPDEADLCGREGEGEVHPCASAGTAGGHPQGDAVELPRGSGTGTAVAQRADGVGARARASPTEVSGQECGPSRVRGDRERRDSAAVAAACVEMWYRDPSANGASPGVAQADVGKCDALALPCGDPADSGTADVSQCEVTAGVSAVASAAGEHAQTTRVTRSAAGTVENYVVALQRGVGSCQAAVQPKETGKAARGPK